MRTSAQGFRNGLIVTAWSSTIALWSARMFAFVARPLRVSASSPRIEGVLLSPLVIPHFTVGLGFLILAAQVGLSRGFAIVVVCHVILVLPFVLRSVYVSLRNLDQRYELAAASLGAPPLRVLTTVTLPLLLPGPGQRLAVCRHPLVQRVHGLAVRDRAAHPNASGRDVQLRARIRRSVDGGIVGHVYRRHRRA